MMTHYDQNALVTLGFGVIAYLILVVGWGIRVEIKLSRGDQSDASMRADHVELSKKVDREAEKSSRVSDAMIEVKGHLAYIRESLDDMRERRKTERL